MGHTANLATIKASSVTLLNLVKTSVKNTVILQILTGLSTQTSINPNAMQKKEKWGTEETR